MELKRVVITGLGALTPVGNSAPETWQALVNGANGIAPITAFDATNFKTQFAGEVKNFDPCVVIDRKDYMIAKFHYMGDKAWEPSAMPDSFELVGVNNYCELLDYDHTRLVLAAYACHLTGFEVIDRAIGGVYEMTMNRKERD